MSGKIIILVPRRLTLEESISFIRSIKSYRHSGCEYCFDFSATGRIEPFAMLFLSSEINRFRSIRDECGFTVTGYDKMTYAKHMGFFHAFGAEIGPWPNAPGGARYIPIKIKNIQDIKRRAIQECIEVGDAIENDASEMAEILSRTDKGILYDTLTYSFREIIRNVVEHSEAEQFGFCAQYWPSYKKVEVALLDRGIGIRNSLKGNPHLTVDSDRSALNLSLMPGLSGKAYPGLRRNPNDVWANSGYGLYMTSRLCRQGGSFFIASGETGVYLSEKKRKYLDTPYKGTGLRLTLNVDRLSDLDDSLKRFRDEGYKISSTYKMGDNLTASVASTMLSRNFDHS